MSHLKALDTQLGLWNPGDSAAAEVALARGLAALLDHDPATGAEIWREYRFALKALREVAGGSDVDDSINQLLDRLGGTGVRDGENVGA